MAESIDSQIQRLTKGFRDVSKRQIPAAHSSAVNKTVSKVKTRTVRGVSRETKVPAKFIRKRFVVSRSKPRLPRSKLTAYQQGVSVASFARNPAVGKKVRAGGKFYPDAFYNSAPQGGVLAYRRKGGARYPIDVLKVDIEEPINRIMPKVSQRVFKNEYPVILRRELIFRANKYAKF